MNKVRISLCAVLYGIKLEARKGKGQKKGRRGEARRRGRGRRRASEWRVGVKEEGKRSQAG
eukprot:712714-Hanusia_phi.AAC.2